MGDVPGRKIYLVGAGPSGPAYATERARTILANARAIIFDPNMDPRFFEGLDASVKRVEAGGLDDVIALAKDAMAAEGSIVRLFEGDPMLLNPRAAEVDALTKLAKSLGVEFEIVPGIAADVALAAFAGRTLTKAGDASPSVAFVRFQANVGGLYNWEKLATATDSIVATVAARDLAEFLRTLTYYGRAESTPASVVADVGRTRQKSSHATVGSLSLPAGVSDDAVVRVLVGPSVEVRTDLEWFERRPLFGKRILVARTKEQAAAAHVLLAERGAEAVIAPSIEIHPPSDPSVLTSAIARLSTDYDWVAFTSANGVEWTMREVRAQKKDARIFGNVKIATIGPATARALLPYGLEADVIAGEYRGESLAADVLQAMGDRAKGARVLLPRAREARDVFPDALRAAGCTLDVVTAYETRGVKGDAATELTRALASRAIDAVLFTSSSTVQQMCRILGEKARSLLEGVCVSSIGPITSQAAIDLGLRVDVTASVYTLNGLVDALEAHFSRAKAETSH